MLRLLAVLFGEREGYVEVRAFNDGPPFRRFYKWPEALDSVEFLSDLHRVSEDHDVYFGVLLRIREGGKAEDTEPLVPYLWADIDKKGGATFSSLLSAPVPPPQIVVDSGRGWHLYWMLDKPMLHDRAQDAMTALASQLGGDMVGDPARILRLPGTFNRKDGGALPVRILRMKDLDKPWRLGDFDLRVVPADRRRIGAVTGTKGTRSEDLFKIAIDGVRGGLDEDDIYAEMLAHEAGSKLTEMTRARADRWVALTVKKARKAVR